jgi:hypothetical protein
MTDLFLIFAMPLDEDPRLNRGRLILFDRTQGTIGRWVATSGLGGGVIPATYQLKDRIPWYKVAAKPLDLSHVRGVEGNGYPITPFEVQTKEGVTRSDLLIHRDANVPGSMGCIVLSGDEFADFDRSFARAVKALSPGVTTVDLNVIHCY